MLYLNESEDSFEKLTNQQLIKEENIKCLFNLLNKNHEMARADMVRMTGLSPTTVSALVEELLRENLVYETGFAKTMQTGRKPINLRINSAGRQIPVFAFSRWGVRYTLYDLNLNTLETLFVEHRSDQYGGFDANQSASPEAGRDYANLARDILLHRSTLFHPEISVAICISMPGIYLQDRQEFSLTALHVTLKKEALQQLEDEFKIPVFFGNSSQSLAYAEKKYLDANGHETENMLYINVCEGVGAGIIQNGEIQGGKQVFAGEIGHVSINYKGRPCSCGGRGCLEQYVNVDAVIERISQIAAFNPNGALGRGVIGNEKLTLEKIGEAYLAGDREIVDALDDIASQLFVGIYSVVCVTGIRKVIVGGGIEKLGEGFLHKLRSLASRTETNLLMHDLTIDYACLGSENIGKGVAQYFIDKKFEIGKRKRQKCLE